MAMNFFLALLPEPIFTVPILLVAGIKYLNLENQISEFFSSDKLIPSAGQGIIALQCRENDEEIISILNKINHNETYKRAHAERNILKVLEGDGVKWLIFLLHSRGIFYHSMPFWNLALAICLLGV